MYDGRYKMVTYLWNDTLVYVYFSHINSISRGSTVCRYLIC